MRRGRRLGLDPGSVRVGVALSDPEGILATPLTTVHRTPSASHGTSHIKPRKPRSKGTGTSARVPAVPAPGPEQWPADVREILTLVQEHHVVEIVVGLARHLSGELGSSAQDGLQLARYLAWVAPEVMVRVVDERLTTVTAQRQQADSGRSVKDSRQVIDQHAATVMLQHALDMERSTGEPPGHGVTAEVLSHEDSPQSATNCTMMDDADRKGPRL